MPIYEYKCAKCPKRFEVLLRNISQEVFYARIVVQRAPGGCSQALPFTLRAVAVKRLQVHPVQDAQVVIVPAAAVRPYYLNNK